MADHINLDHLNGEIKAAIRAALPKLEQEIKDTERLHVYYDVYDAYTPKMYTRRMDAGGLSSASNFVTKVTERRNGFEIEGENVTTGNRGKRLDQIIETGKGYKWGRVPARPFMKNAQKSVNKEAKDILKASLIAQGLNVK